MQILKGNFWLIIFFSVVISLAFRKDEKAKIWMIGDSTMANKKPAAFPETGWGMEFGAFFDSRVTIDNRALNGRSTLSFRTEKHWDEVMAAMQPDDYVMIEFGHNDEKTDKPGVGTTLEEFKNNLSRYVVESREKKAFPILLTPITRRNFKNGELKDSHGGYPAVVRQVADSLHVPLIDMLEKSSRLLTSYGEVSSQQLFNYVDSGSVNYPNGKKDNTHFSRKGATEMAKLAAESLKGMHTGLEKFIKK